MKAHRRIAGALGALLLLTAACTSDPDAEDSGDGGGR